MARPCPACASPNREELEARLTSKESFRLVSEWLLREKKESIHKSTLHKHARAHIGHASQFAGQLLSFPRAVAPSPTQEPRGLPSDIALPPLEALAHVQNIALRIVDALFEQLGKEGLTSLQVTLFTGVLKEARQTAKNRHELVHGKKFNIDANINRPRRDLSHLSDEELRQRRDELRRQREEREANKDNSKKS